MEGPELTPVEEVQPKSELREVDQNRKQRRAEAARKRKVKGPVPDRMSVIKGSPFKDDRSAFVGVRFNGKEMNSVIEYCVSEGWIREYVLGDDGKPLIHSDEYVEGNRFYGNVEVYWKL